MARSLSLAAYRALSRHRHEPSEGQSEPPRPEGELVWAHAGDPARLVALGDLAERLKLIRPGVQVLLTHDGSAPPDKIAHARRGGDWVAALTTDHPSSALQFLAHWTPNLCLWTGAGILVNTVSATAETGIPMILADIDSADFHHRRHNWLPTLKRASFDVFDTIFACTDASAREIVRLGIAGAKVRVTARLRGCPTPPLCTDDDLAEITTDLAGRPVWLAAHIRRDEIAAVLAAHRTALRLSHRLVLIATLADRADSEELVRALRQSRLRFANWDNGDRLDDNIQVLICDSGEDLGLWYRTAPLCFLASSLTPGHGGINPYDAASLGSAILFGPNVRDHLELYERLAKAGAARKITDSTNLAAALVELVAPDKAAAMALAGWEIATEGAELTDTLIELVQTRLDAAGADHARP